MPLNDLLMKIAKGEKLNPQEMGDFERDANSLSTANETLKKWLAIPNHPRIDKLDVGVLSTDVPYNRSITYGGITNSPVASGYTNLELSWSRGYINQNDACVIYKPGKTDEWIRNPIVSKNQQITVLAQVTINPTNTSTNYNIYLDFYRDGASYGSYYSYNTGSGNSTTNTLAISSLIPDEDSIKLKLYQNFGSVAVADVELTFCVI